MPRRARSLALGVALPLAGALGSALALAVPARAQAPTEAPRATRPRTVAEDLQLFSQVLNQLRVNHPDSLDTHRLIMAAVAGMVRAADPHSYVLPALRLSPERARLAQEGKLHFVPVSFHVSDGVPRVASVASGSKAARLDLLRGDELVAVDGGAVVAESGEELDLALAGPGDRPVRLTLERRRPDGTVARFDRVVRREREIDGETAVPVATLLPGGAGYVRVTTFAAEKVADDLRRAIATLDGKGAKGLVLDLRDNGGGSVAEASAVAGEFLPANTVVWTSEGRKTDVVDTGRVKRSFWKRERSYPLVVLVNEGSASASELVAGALQDHDRAVIVGRRTFGKSLLMRGVPLSDGSMMWIVVGRVRTPCGRVVQRPYRDRAARRYYDEAGRQLDTTAAPAESCRNASGRMLGGGGGIVPDVVLDRRVRPVWLSRLAEEGISEQWAGGWVTERAAALTAPAVLADAKVLDDAALASFVTFARDRKFTVPDDAEAREQLRAHLARAAALAKWGDAGLYLLVALTDAEVQAAVGALERAARLTVAERE